MKGIINFIKRTCFIPAVLVVLSACAHESRDKDILSQQEMVAIMEELYIAEEKINRLGLDRDSSKQIFERLGTKVFQNAAVTDSVFKKSLDYYMERPDELEKIYAALVDTLQLREQRAPVPDR